MKGPAIAPFVVIGALMCAPSAGWAQTAATGGIAGVVRDPSGGVLPGVTVEAASPALIEKVRTAVTDGDGVFRIIDLRSGAYTVTFTLPGFNTLRREGIDLTAGFTATVNGELAVGALEETITVTGAAPVVDVQNVRQQQVLSREVRNALPLPSHQGAYAAIIPGATQVSTNRDVGGTRGEQAQNFTIHGGRTQDYQQQRDGMFYGTLAAAGNLLSSVNTTSIQEVTVLTSGGATAESETGGAQVNLVPRDGGNTFNGNLLANFSNKGLQSDNLDDGLRARGATTPGDIKDLYEVAGGFGGPVLRDKLWFFTSARRWVSSQYMPGNYFNKRQGTLFYEPDLARPAFEDNFFNETSLRLTWQAAQKHKVTGMFRVERNCNCFFNIRTGAFAPEATGDDFYWPNWQSQVAWSYPATNRLLFQAGATAVDATFGRRLTGGTYDDISVLDLARNYRYGSSGGLFGATTSWGYNKPHQYNQSASMAYVTGSHAFKVGMQHRYAPRDFVQSINHNISYTFRGTVPQSVTYFTGPHEYRVRQRTIALYAQDQWTMQRLTLSLGLRYDTFGGWVPEQRLAAGPYVGERFFPARDDVINWKDLNPRIGGSYDLFGTGRTAVKVSVARYVTFQPNQDLMTTISPVNQLVTSSTRNWTDANGDYIPQESELGPHSASNFGQLRPGTTIADDVLRGFATREYSWQGSAAIQHELRQGLAVSLGYFRTWYGNFNTTDNRAVTPADYDPYCVTAPTDSRLPGGVSGAQVCGLYDLKAAKFGLVDNLITKSANYGNQIDMYNGVDLTVNARLAGGGVVTGGMSVGRTVTDVCEVLMDSPDKRFCRNTPPWSSGMQVKLGVVYPLVWDLQASAVFQNVAAIPTTSSYVVGNAVIAPSLGRNLSGGGNATRTIELVEINSFYPEGRSSQLDLRLSRTVRFGGRRVEAQFDVFNAFNANDVLAINTRYGAAWQNATAVLTARILKFGLQVNF